MVWGARSERCAISLCIVNGTVYSANYCDILNSFLLETAMLYPNGWCF